MALPLLEEQIQDVQFELRRLRQGHPVRRGRTCARFRVLDPPGFGLMDPPCMGYRRSRRLGVLRVLFARSKFSGFDATVGIAGDVDSKRRVLESVTDRVEDDLIGDNFVPVSNR